MSLNEALAVVKAAGFRVTKPKAKRVKSSRVGPTFVAKFADGEVTRMSTFTSLADLDWERGVRLAHAAWSSRFRSPNDSTSNRYKLPPVVCPPVISAHFEQDGKVLARYDRPSKWVGTGKTCEV
jgi:hypothetical protein